MWGQKDAGGEPMTSATTYCSKGREIETGHWLHLDSQSTVSYLWIVLQYSEQYCTSRMQINLVLRSAQTASTCKGGWKQVRVISGQVLQTGVVRLIPPWLLQVDKDLHPLECKVLYAGVNLMSPYKWLARTNFHHSHFTYWKAQPSASHTVLSTQANPRSLSTCGTGTVTAS